MKRKVVFAGEELLHKKVNNKEVYVNYDTITDFTEDDAVKKYGDLTALTQVTKALKIKH